MPDTPEAVQFRLTIAGGVNPRGEPNFRVVWGRHAKVMDCVDGQWMPRYLPADNWHLDAWIPPEKNPPRGGYEHCYALGKEINPSQVEKIVEMILGSRNFTIQERRAAIEEREAKAERDYDAEAFDILDDGVRAFHQQPYVALPIRKDLENDR